MIRAGAAWVAAVYLATAFMGGCSRGSASDDSTTLGRIGTGLTREDCPFGSNVIEGTAGDDVLLGTSRADCILGFDGNDLIDGGNGNDFLAGGDGDDTLEGGNGVDRVFGELGSDDLRGGNGSDWIEGGDGDDSIQGENGPDTLSGDAGNDILIGGNGADVIAGGAGNDVILDDDTPDSVDPGEGLDSCHHGCEVAPATACTDHDDCSAGALCQSGACLRCWGDADCNDGRICNGQESCVPVNGCAAGVSEPYGTVVSTCSRGTGACRTSDDLICDGSGGTQCTAVPGEPESDSNCDGIDDDCDGHTDEDYILPFTSCGVGACGAAGLLECRAGGTLVDTCVPGAPAVGEACDGLDNDCDGTTDEGLADDDADGICDSVDACPYRAANPTGVTLIQGRIECVSLDGTSVDFLGIPYLPIRLAGYGETQTDCEGNFAIPITDGRDIPDERHSVNVKFWYDSGVPGPSGIATRLRVTDAALAAWGTNDVFHTGYDRNVFADVSTGPAGETILTAQTFRINSSECEIWRIGAMIATDYHEATRAPIQGGTLQYMRRTGYFDTGPFAFYDYVDLHEGFIASRPHRSGRESTLFHETGHIIRDYADGGRSHWDADNVHYDYAQCHLGREIREQGYAFHEGWATYWAQARHGRHTRLSPSTTDYCDGNVGPRGIPLKAGHRDWVERMISDRLLDLAACYGGSNLDAGDRILVETLQAHPESIHSLFELETALKDAFGCTGDCCPVEPERCPDGYEDFGTCIGYGGHNVRYD